MWPRLHCHHRGRKTAAPCCRRLRLHVWSITFDFLHILPVIHRLRRNHYHANGPRASCNDHSADGGGGARVAHKSRLVPASGSQAALSPPLSLTALLPFIALPRLMPPGAIKKHAPPQVARSNAKPLHEPSQVGLRVRGSLRPPINTNPPGVLPRLLTAPKGSFTGSMEPRSPFLKMFSPPWKPQLDSREPQLLVPRQGEMNVTEPTSPPRPGPRLSRQTREEASQHQAAAAIFARPLN